MTLQFPTLTERTLWLALATLIVVAVLHDLLQSWLLHYHFYWSESVLFKACWLPFPLLYFVQRHRLAWLGLALLHVMLFALIVNLGSHLLFDHTYDLVGLLRKTLAEDLYKYLLVYGAFSLLKTKSSPAQLLIKNGKHNQKVTFAEINYICADDPYIAVHTRTKKHLSSTTLKAIEQDLPENFVRIHRSTIINIAQVDHFVSRLNGDYDVTLICGTILRISRSYSKNFRERLGR